MSLSLKKALRSNPVLTILAVVGLAITTVPFTVATHFGTGGADVLLDASSTVFASNGTTSFVVMSRAAGPAMRNSTSYELTIENIDATNDSNNVQIMDVNGTVVVPSSPLSTGNDGPGGHLKNVSFIITTSSFRSPGTYIATHVATNASVGSMYVEPIDAPADVHFVFDGPMAMNSTAIVGTPVNVSTTLGNTGSESGSVTLLLFVNGAQRDARTIAIAPHADAAALFNFTPVVAGVYSVALRLPDGSEQDGSLTVTTPPQPMAKFAIGSFNGSILHPTIAPITMRGASNFGTATVTLSVNTSIVEIVNVTPGNITGANTTWHYDNASGTVTILVTTSARPSNVSGDFVFAYVTLRPVGPIGSRSALDLNVAELADAEGAAQPATATSGTFRVGIIGDVNGDGIINAQDLDALSAVIVGAQPQASIFVEDADLNADGHISGVDALYLRQYLAGTRAQL